MDDSPKPSEQKRTTVKDVIEYLQTLEPELEISINIQWFNAPSDLHYDKELRCVFN